MRQTAKVGQFSKEALRAEALRRRSALSIEERQEKSMQICRAVMEDDLFLDAQAIHVYLPLDSEVNIRPLVDVAWEMGKEVGIMRVLDDGGTVQYDITPDTKFRTASNGIPEPIDAESFDMESCDLVIVPIVAADESCNRIGYGRGYYDQFLTHHPRPTIGVAFDVQIFPELPHEDTDMHLDVIYTESREIVRPEKAAG
jgi:5-formyltetrahydrofolate cyclo-ligase